MTASEERIHGARRMVLDVLEGKLTEQADPAVFADDLLYINVRILEERQSDWLFERLAAADYAPERRRLVAGNLSPRGQARVADLF